MTDKKSVSLEECMQKIESVVTSPDDLALVRKAWEVAHEAHSGQFRKSGEPYEVHPIQVAYILACLGCNAATIAAGFLHDVVEDCEGYTRQTIADLFSEDIASLVEGVTKVGKLPDKFQDEQEYQASNHRKIFISMAKDPRVIYIKLADRLHNMRTLQFQKPEKQKKIARETLEVYARIAHRLGISVIKTELEELSFYYLAPQRYMEIRDLVAMGEDERNKQVRFMMNSISSLLNSKNVHFSAISGRSKNYYSIYKKMLTKNKTFDEILDLQAIRIITETKQDCYDILGHIHSAYLPIPGRFKDYIAVPKDNMYQSLHTIVQVPGTGRVVEIQIRTKEMDQMAEVGVAAHFRYKEHPGSDKEEFEDKLTWFRNLATMAEEESEDAVEFMKGLYNDIFGASLYCFTPKGKMISLPANSTPIDFAYRIHTEVGNHTVGAKVNDAIVPLNHVLKTGDIVEILTNRSSAGPSIDWIQFAQSSHARNKIRAWHQKIDFSKKRELIREGENIVAEAFRSEGISESLRSKTMKQIPSLFSHRNLDDLYAAVAAGRLPVQRIVEKLVKSHSNTLEDNEEVMAIFNNPERKTRPTACGVIVEGTSNIQVSLAGCCAPVPGDPIVGFVTKGNGIKVHHRECRNVRNVSPSRFVPVSWSDEPAEKLYLSRIVIYAQNRNYLVSDIMIALQQHQADIRHVESKVNADSLTATTKVEIGIHGRSQLDRLLVNLRKIRSVTDVERSLLS